MTPNVEASGFLGRHLRDFLNKRNVLNDVGFELSVRVADGLEHPSSSSRSIPVLLCFLTTRGIATSPVLGRRVCRACFERRWSANLAYWEHAPQLQRQLDELRRRNVHWTTALPPMAGALAAALIKETLADDVLTPLYRHVDLLRCELHMGEVLRIHGCATCYRLRSSCSE